jgi:hypothetical protein
MRECSNSRHLKQRSLHLVYEGLCCGKMYRRMKRTFWNHHQLRNDRLQCLRASTTLHEAQINKAEIRVQLRFSVFSNIKF